MSWESQKTLNVVQFLPALITFYGLIGRLTGTDMMTTDGPNVKFKALQALEA